MGYSVSAPCGQFNYNMSHKKGVSFTHNIKVAMWHLPYNSHYKDYDEDDTKWFEANNQQGNNEIKKAEQNLNISLSKYEVRTGTIRYDDGTYEVFSQYNNHAIRETHGNNYLFVKITDNADDVVAEKVFGFDSNDGRKFLYKHYKNGKDTFTVVKVYSYDTTKNRATDVVNFGYTSDPSKLTNGCTFEKEYYMLNGKQTDVKKGNGGYIVKNEDGKILTFQVE